MLNLLCFMVMTLVVTSPVEIPFRDGDTMPDFSRVGYRWGDVEIPSVKVVKTLTPPRDGADATGLIQEAIDQMDEPGAILLKAGTYNVSGSIHINRSGVVLRGEGMKKTRVVATGDKQRTLITLGKPDSQRILDEVSATAISEEVVPLGRLYVEVKDPEEFKIGDRVVLRHDANAEWIHAIGMDRIVERVDDFGRMVRQWRPEDYSECWERIITKIDGNRIWFDNPVVFAIHKKYGGGSVIRCSYDRVEECGVENIAFISEYDESITAVHKKTGDVHYADEAHAWVVVKFTGAEHCWMRNCSARHFGYSCAFVEKGAKNITVQHCFIEEPVSLIYGARRYGFCLDRGELTLFKDCHADHDRHGFICQAHTCGPNVYTQSEMTNAYDDAGPHHRWTTGTLYDAVKTDNRIRVQDRGGSGYGHGWTGAGIFMWNCEASEIVAQSVYGIHDNYAVGCIAKHGRGWFPERPDGVWISEGRHVEPVSLYEWQLEQRRKAGIKAAPQMCYETLWNTEWDPVQSQVSSMREVDLGLSVNWAGFNVGATSPEEPGYYFAWGETEPKKEYTLSNYKYCNGDRNSFTKYVADSHGQTDGKLRLEAEDDAASVNWGGGWRMPTRDELNELYEKCRKSFVTYKGMDGYLFTGPNGNSIFIPAAGIWVPGKGLCQVGHNGSYYTCDLDEIESVGASGVYFYSAAWGETGHYREYGRSVRAVRDR